MACGQNSYNQILSQEWREWIFPIFAGISIIIYPYLSIFHDLKLDHPNLAELRVLAGLEDQDQAKARVRIGQDWHVCNMLGSR